MRGVGNASKHDVAATSRDIQASCQVFASGNMRPRQVERKAMVVPVTIGCLSSTSNVPQAATCLCSVGLNLNVSHSRDPIGRKFSSTTSPSVNTTLVLGELMKRSSISAILFSYQKSSWSHKKITSPLQAQIAISKLHVEPVRLGLVSSLTANGTRRAKSRTIARVLSLEASSETINSSGSRV